MGIIISCFKEKKRNTMNDRLITNIICPTCCVSFVSNYEYNKHIPMCNPTYGDL